MSRLIDADDFKKFLQALCRAGAPYKEVIQLLDKQPTAFDTEKVVEQLEGLSNAEADYYYARSNDVIDRDDAIDIVKKGGVE